MYFNNGLLLMVVLIFMLYNVGVPKFYIKHNYFQNYYLYTHYVMLTNKYSFKPNFVLFL